MASFLKSSVFLPIISGLLLWLSFPGGGELWPLLFIALVPLLYSLSSGSVKTKALCGLICGLVHFLLLLYWIVIVLGTYGGLPLFVSLFALLLLAFYMSLYFALFAVLAGVMQKAFPPWLVLWLLPALWVGLDWGRGILFTGFPWMDLGYALFEIPLLIQVGDLVGHHGITFLVVFVNCLVVLVLQQRRSFSCYVIFLLSAIVLFGSAGIYSKMRLAEINSKIIASDTPKINVGIVQGNIDQSEKWSSLQQKSTVEIYSSQTTALFESNLPSLVIWPETALPFYPPSNPQMQPLQELVGHKNFALLTGAPWYEIINLEAKQVKFFNSAFLLEPDGQLGDRYSKLHLVPFGEYVPFKKYLPFLAPLVEAVGDFSPGKIEKPISWKTAKAGILICFESVFPELSRQWVLAGANMLINLTNDAWYGKSSAPYHSLAMSVLRAVETRRSVARSANTGISAFISPAGTISQRSDLFVEWAASDEVVLLEEKTVWVMYGYLFGPVCLLLGLLGACIGWMRR